MLCISLHLRIMFINIDKKNPWYDYKDWYIQVWMTASPHHVHQCWKKTLGMIIRIDTYSSLKDKGFLSIKTNEYYFCNHLKSQDSKHRIQKKPSFACKIIKSSLFKNLLGVFEIKASKFVVSGFYKTALLFYHIVISQWKCTHTLTDTTPTNCRRITKKIRVFIWSVIAVHISQPGVY